jgi:hypothetical protein
MKTKFYATEVLPAFRDQVIETEIFRQNGVAISARTKVYTNEVLYSVSYDEEGYTAYAAADTLAQALVIAENKQVLR